MQATAGVNPTHTGLVSPYKLLEMTVRVGVGWGRLRRTTQRIGPSSPELAWPALAGRWETRHTYAATEQAVPAVPTKPV